MKTIQCFTSVIVFLIFSYQAFSQLNPQGVAPGIENSGTDFITHSFPLSVKASELVTEDESGADFGVPLRVAVSVPVQQDFFTMGKWTYLPDGGRYYTVQLSSENAYALSIAFEQFYVPENAMLFFYCPERKNVFGGFTHIDNTASGLFPSPVIENDTVIIEYFEPEPLKVDEKPVFKIMEVAHFYRPVNESFKNGQIGTSWPCHVNVNCSEGDDWIDQKRGVARILLRVGENYGWCSGSLVNNTAQDGTPYLLTAKHCGINANEYDRNLWQFRFNFERPGCADEGLPPSQSIPGATLIALTEIEGGSDMQLLLLNFLPPPSFQPYYNGWDRRVDAPHFGVGIHHPNGDVKKISTFSEPAVTINNAVVSGFQLAYRAIWNVIFVATDNGHGVTQGGSSGSPLFNQDKLIVGTLTGGNSSCTNTEGNNLYGKLNYHWESNGPFASEQLKPWLDPLGSGQQSLQGLDLYPAPSVQNLSGTLGLDTTITLKWNLPAYEQLNSYWYANISNYNTVIYEGPERATKFRITEHLDIDTFFIEKLSHLFWEHPNYLWGGDNSFVFRIYDNNGQSILYESPILLANNFQDTNTPVTYELESPVAVTGDFYVAVVPGESGHPSSLAMDVNDITTSYYGSSGNWQLLSFNQKYYELLLSVFGSVSSEPDKEMKLNDFSQRSELISVKDNMILLGHDLDHIIRKQSNHMSILSDYTQVLMENIKYYNIYKDGVIIAQTDHAGVFEFIDKDDLELEETYTYFLTAVYDINPANPYSPDLESQASDVISVKVSFEDENTNIYTVSHENNGIRIFPNPSKGVFRVMITQADEADEIEIKVYDIGGRLVNTSTQVKDDLIFIDMTSEPGGIYFIKTYSRNGIRTGRVVKL